MQEEPASSQRQTFVRLPASLHKRIRMIAVEKDTSLQALLREAVERIVQEQETA